VSSHFEDIRRLENIISKLSDQLIRERERRDRAENAKHKLIEENDSQHSYIRELQAEIAELRGR
jgi:hypothetical protein